MQNSYGNVFNISIFGESHGKYLGATINGLCSGLKIDLDNINSFLAKRRPQSELSTKRVELDDLEFISGYFNGYTTGTALTFLIKNRCQETNSYQKATLRPSHSDYAAKKKYADFNDYRGGGQSSGRTTAVLCVIGAIASQILNDKGIKIGSHIKELHGVKDRSFNNFLQDFETLKEKQIPTLNDLEEKITKEVLQAKTKHDSVGGIIESAVIGMEAGIGEPYFDSVESKLSSILYSIPAVKGVEFGLGFNFKDYYASEVNDQIYYAKDFYTKTNYNGGINGGITNGMPIVVKTVVKPTPSIGIEQHSVDYYSKEEVKLKINGRHDPCILIRVPIVIDSCIAIALLDLYSMRYGYEWQRS